MSDAIFMRSLMESMGSRTTPEYQEGYDAGLEFHMTGSVAPLNPYNEDGDEARAAEWDRGFEDAGLDS